ncbi:S1C family serine protease [Actinophytocola sp.]|uniref:S1C family serine protease n=1 Tax=Actinophytocola sp. TaxID=1872138 RepID=UPI002ED774E7
MIKHSIGGHRWSGRGPALGGVAAVALLLAAGCTAGGATVSGTAATSTPVAQPAQSAPSIEQQFVQVVKTVGPSVVLVSTDQGLGSGIVFDTKGDIVTNNHVVSGSHSFQVTLASGKQYPARLVGSFAPDDLAVLHVSAPGLRAASFADSRTLSVGDLALAIGNPLGLQSSVTEGIVSALGRTVNEDNGVTLPNVIQTSAAINPGNSGGALVDLRGQVIGIPTLAATDPQLGGGSAPGIGFAIASNMVKNIATQLIDQGTVTNTNRGYLGVQVGSTTSGGVLVTQVQAGGPAASAGIRTGDLITAINGTATPDPTTLSDVVAGLKPGQTASVAITHANGTTQTVEVTLGQYPG